MGKGVGRRLFEHARAVAAGAGVRVLEIDSDPNAEAFYCRMGAVRVGEIRSELEKAFHFDTLPLVNRFSDALDRALAVLEKRMERGS